MGIKQKINYKIYTSTQKVKGNILNSIPSFLIPKRTDLKNDLQIAITTYVDRYDLFFKPLLSSLRATFPDITISVAVNGFHDTRIQSEYLDRFYSDLCVDSPKTNWFILHDKPVGLTRLWNELLSQGSCDTTLILNDDLKIYPWMRPWIESKPWTSTLTLINGTWSHYFLSKKVLDIVGWFDEDFQGIGFEDMDYTARCALKKIDISNVTCQHITHLDHQPSRTSFDDRSQTLWGPKYSSINHDAFFRKWRICDDSSAIYIKQLNACVVPNKPSCHAESRTILRFTNNVCYPDRD